MDVFLCGPSWDFREFSFFHRLWLDSKSTFPNWRLDKLMDKWICRFIYLDILNVTFQSLFLNPDRVMTGVLKQCFPQYFHHADRHKQVLSWILFVFQPHQAAQMSTAELWSPEINNLHLKTRSFSQFLALFQRLMSLKEWQIHICS